MINTTGMIIMISNLFDYSLNIDVVAIGSLDITEEKIIFTIVIISDTNIIITTIVDTAINIGSTSIDIGIGIGVRVFSSFCHFWGLSPGPLGKLGIINNLHGYDRIQIRISNGTEVSRRTSVVSSISIGIDRSISNFCYSSIGTSSRSHTSNTSLIYIGIIGIHISISISISLDLKC